LRVYNNDLQQAQDLLMTSLSLRKTGPHVFTNRDVSSNEVAMALKTM